MKLLYLAHLFPPARFVACLRTWNTAKQLSRLGWKVTIVTLRPDIWRSVDNPEGVAQAIKNLGLEMVYTKHKWPWLNTDNLQVRHPKVAWAIGGPIRRLLRRIGVEGQTGWASAAKKACSDFSHRTFDAILATGSPYLSFPLARTLSLRLRCPYVLDYRDLWTSGNPHVDKKSPPWIRALERRSIDDAAAVIIVSRTWGELLNQSFRVKNRLHVISNGYCGEELAGVEAYQFSEPAIVYSGGFYPPKRILLPVFSALRSLNQPNLRWKFHYYGGEEAIAKADADQAGISERLVTHGVLPRAASLAAAKGAHLAIVVTSVLDTSSLSDRGIVTGKVFELVGMGVPVLLVAPDGSDAEQVILNCGRRFSGSQVTEMSRYISNIINEPKKTYKPPAEFSWESLGTQFHKVLQAVRSYDW